MGEHGCWNSQCHSVCSLDSGHQTGEAIHDNGVGVGAEHPDSHQHHPGSDRNHPDSELHLRHSSLYHHGNRYLLRPGRPVLCYLDFRHRRNGLISIILHPERDQPSSFKKGRRQASQYE